VTNHTVNFGMLEYLIQEVDVLLAQGTHFDREMSKQYCGAYPKLYYFIVAIYRILKIMTDKGTANWTQIEFVSRFERSVGVDSLPIDGAVKPFFAALTSSTPESPYVIDVVPYLPSVNEFPLNNGNNHTFPDEHINTAPNLISLFLKIQRLNTAPPAAQPPNPAPVFHAEWNLSGFAANDQDTAPGTPHANRRIDYALLSPGTLFRDIAPCGQGNVQHFRNNNFKPDIPAANIGQAIDNELDWCHLSNNFTWFHGLINIMDRRATYIEGSTTLGNIPLHGYGVSKLEIRLTEDAIDWTNMEADHGLAAASRNRLREYLEVDADAVNQTLRERKIRRVKRRNDYFQGDITVHDREHNTPINITKHAMSISPYVPSISWTTPDAPAAPPVSLNGPFNQHTVLTATAPDSYFGAIKQFVKQLVSLRSKK
jgi:hypothetical protein